MQNDEDIETATPILPPPEKKKSSKSWVRLIRKVYKAEPLVCKKCGGQLKVVAVIVDPKQARRITAHLGLPDYRAPPTFGARPNVYLNDVVQKNAA